ncbi:MAG: transcription-repair coupling factor [Eubacteriales bacterium]|nr:transcription-repair coupling factor [Eubacteriales bacterium]
MYNSIIKEKAYEALVQELRRASAPICVTGLAGGRKAQLVDTLSGNDRWSLFITADEKQASELESDLKTFDSNPWIYPAKDLLFSSSDIHGNFINNQRTDARKHLMEDKYGVLITTIQGLMDKIPSRQTISSDKLTIKEAYVINQENLIKMLRRLGYERTAEVEAMGQFAVRGGIFDIFPVSAELPVRVEFFDDEVDTIRSFDCDTKRSLERLPEVDIYPIEGSSKGEVSLLDYFPEGAVIFADDPIRLKAVAELTETEFREAFERRKDREQLPDDIFSSNETIERLKRPGTIFIAALDDSLKEFGCSRSYSFKTGAVGVYKESIELLAADIKKYAKDAYRITVMTPSRTRTSRLAETLREMEIRAYCPDESSGELKEGNVEVVYGRLHKGFTCPDIRYVLFTEADMFGQGYRKKKKKFEAKGDKLNSLDELSVGDYVVHESHGIGIYRGIEHIERDGSGKDYIKVEYGDGGNLYIPATRLDLLQKYAGADARRPKLSKLNSGEWQKTKQRVSKSVDKLAAELVELYAKRSIVSGVKYGRDTVWQREFEELFPYEETDDQLNAIAAVKHDMESGRIMDRLICGDVGYGKTEIALRAAFKAVQEGKQVAYLVPTTILARQHYNTFKERMCGFPVEVGMMSRFHSSAENKKIAEKLGAGAIDVVIGTHRLLSKDVKFKDLGLLIIDEEQRFGVAHKEKIKQLKTDVDVLVLTATPIPRTLHMSLSGIRDLSILEEPPFDRVPIQTYVMEYDDELVREAVTRELQRNGQVYYVYNRVKGIEEKTDKLRSLMPDARIEYAHGQMNEHELEAIMLDFVEGRIDMLVSTTIVETGLDIPNANTLIIDGAERLGLSQLYQLRGRVGRSNRTAYAFLMYRKDKILSDEAEKRLKAIREFTEFGSGIKIAMRDLEIRGAGNVLGSEQHGQMEAVGYELYCKLLQRSVRRLKGTLEPTDEYETQVECDIDAFIPDSYIPSEYQKLDIYKRIATISNDEQALDMQDELVDRFGDIPNEVMNLLRVAQVKNEAHKAYVTELNVHRDGFNMIMWPKARINVDAIPDLVGNERGKLALRRGATPEFIYRDPKSVHLDASKMLLKAEEVIKALVLPNM